MTASGQNATDTTSPVRHRSYRSGFAFGGLGFLTATALGIVSMVVTSRMYGVRIIGEFALVSAPVGALWVLSTVKEQQALIKEITGLPPRHPRVTQLFAAVFTFSSGLTAVMATLDAVACWFVFRGPLHHPELVAPTFVSLAGYAIVTNTGWNIDSIFSAFVAGRELFLVRLHEVLSFIVIAIAIGLVWQSVWGLVIATIGGYSTALAHRVSLVRTFVRAHLSMKEYRAGLRVLPELLRFGLRATPGQLAQGVSQQGGVWALGIVAQIGVVGAYSRAQMIPQRLQQASMRISEVLYPTLVGRHTKGDSHGFDRAMIDSIRYEMIGMLLIAATLGGAAQSVLEIFGPGFSRAASALALLALYPALASVTVTQTQALWATNRPGLTSIIAIARVTVTVVLLLVLTPRVGITGPAFALLAGYLAVIILSASALRHTLARPLHLTWPRRERLALIASYASGFVAAHLTEYATRSATVLPIRILLSILAGTTVYAAIFLVCDGLNMRDRDRLREFTVGVRSWRKRQADSGQPASPEDGVVSNIRIESRDLDEAGDSSAESATTAASGGAPPSDAARQLR